MGGEGCESANKMAAGGMVDHGGAVGWQGSGCEGGCWWGHEQTSDDEGGGLGQVERNEQLSTDVATCLRLCISHDQIMSDSMLRDRQVQSFLLTLVTATVTVHLE